MPMEPSLPERARCGWESPIRRLAHLYRGFARGVTLGVRALVIDAQGLVFMVKHSYVSGWHMPGGGIDPGETLDGALARELREEGNIELAAPPRLHGIYFNDRDSRRDHVALFVVREFRLSAAPVTDREIVASGFFAIGELPDATTRATRARIREVLAGAPLSERW